MLSGSWLIALGLGVLVRKIGVGCLATGLRLALPAFAYRGASSSSSPPPPVPSHPRVGDPLPNEALFLVSSLRAADRQSRALRAWQAGLQAGLVLRGEQNVVEPTPAIAVRSRVYIVLRCRGDLRVRFFTAFGRFKLYVGALEHSDSVCHGFSTEGEARVYAKAAFVDFPEPEQWN